MNLKRALDLFIDFKQAEGFSERTCESYGYDLKHLYVWAESQHLISVNEIEQIIKSYPLYVFNYISPQTKQKLSMGTQHKKLATLKSFCHFLFEKGYYEYDLAPNIKLPKLDKRLPRGILSLQEIDQMLELPNVNDIYGLRDKAILETLYATGIRASELCDLTLQSVDITRQNLRVFGKGKKERMLPLHNRVNEILVDYINQSRIHLLEKSKKIDDINYLFLNRSGHYMERRTLSKIVKRYAKQVREDLNITSHCIRHSIATHLLQNGADTRFIQQFLGHNSLESTQIYTRVNIDDLHDVVERFHPLGRDV